MLKKIKHIFNFWFKRGLKSRLKVWLKYKLCRARVKRELRIDEKYTLTKIQLKALQTTYSLMTDSDVELLSNPNDDKCYLKKVDDKDNLLMFITITKSANTGFFINIIGRDLPGNDGRYHYDIWIDDHWGRKIVLRFYKVLSRRRNKMENEIRQNDEAHLESIYKHVQKITKQNERVNKRKNK